MHYNVDTPQEYLDGLENDWRKKTLTDVRFMILSHKSCSKEVIEYKMLAYRFGDKTLFHLNAQKNYVSLYIGNINKVPDGRELLKNLDIGKGCIRIKKSISLSDTNIETFIQNVIEMWKSDGDVDC